MLFVIFWWGTGYMQQIPCCFNWRLLILALMQEMT